MHRLLLIITLILISLAGFAQTTPSDSIQEARKAKIEKARAAARAKAESLAAERAKKESEGKKASKKNEDTSNQETVKKESDSKKADSRSTSKTEEKSSTEKSKKERKSRDEKKDNNVNAAKNASTAKETPKEEKQKKQSIKERNMADSTVAKSKYGPGTFGLRGNIGATVAWSDYSDRKDKIGFDSWGFVLSGGVGYRFNHIAYAGLLMDVEFIELLAFSPMVDFVVAAPTPVSPFIELTAGPYISYDEDRKWVFQPRAGLSYRGKKNKIMRFGFGLRMYDDAFNSDSFKPQYAASVTCEF